LTVSVVSQPSNGTLTQGSDGKYEYDPPANWTGTDTFTIKGNDGVADSNTATVTIGVTNGTFIWTGAGSDDLASDSLNWNNDVAPISGDLVIFNGTSSKDANFDSSFTSTLATLEIDAGYTGQITLQQDLTISALLSQSAGTIVLGSNNLDVASAASYKMSAGELDGPGYLNITGTMNWTGGNLSAEPGTLTIATGAVLNIAPTGSQSITGWTINIDGIANWTQGDIQNADSTVNVNADGTFYLSSPGTWADALGDGGSSINNAGTMNSTDNGTGMPVSIQVALNTSGTVNVQAGSLTIKNGGTTSGAFVISAGSSLDLLAGVLTANEGATFTSLQQGPGPRGWFTIRSEFAVAGTVTENLDIFMRDGGSVNGPGTLVVNGRFTWHGGGMRGSGVTQINGTMVVDFTDAPNDRLILARKLTNTGTVILVGNQSEFKLGVDAANGGSFTNNGQVDFNTIAGGAILALESYFGDESGETIVNNSQFIVTGGGSARLQTTGGPPVINGATGIITVKDGSSLTVGGGLMNYGYLEASAGASVRFRSGKFTFDPNMNETSGDMMRGAGSFILYHFGGTIEVPQNCLVHASNFYLQDGTVEGQGDFSAQYFAWSGGKMSEDGTTTVESGARMDISNSVTLNARTIRDWGTITWQYAESEQIIAMENSAQLQIDGGRFETFNVNGKITRDPLDQSDNRIVVSNNGAFVTNITEVSGTVTIEPRFENNGGLADIQGNTSFSSYHQDGAGSVSRFGGGLYQLAAPNNRVFDGGRVELQGGHLNAAVGFTNTEFSGYGDIDLLLSNQSTITLTGNLSVDITCGFSNQTFTYLGGYQLSAPTINNNAGCTINCQGGGLVGMVFDDGIITD
jgi:Bacterial Ig domain